jgi:GT2 family glycosyltransferase/glycosyltransferase involved in cell wall biosynthesis
MWKKKDESQNVRQSSVRGYIDGVIGRRAVGWLAEAAPSGDPTIVEILSDGMVVAEGKANLFRQDLQDALIGDGSHGFDISLPESLFNGQTRQIFARSKRYKTFLQGSPKSINAPLATSTDALRIQEGVSGIVRSLETRIVQLEAAVREQTDLLRSIQSALTTPTGPSEVLTPTADRGPFFEACREHPHERGDIIFFSIIDWNFRVQRPQHIASRLAKLGYRVMYVSVHLGEWSRSWDSRFEIFGNPAHGVFETRLRLAGDLPSIYSGLTDPTQLKETVLALDDLVRSLEISKPIAIIQFPSWYPVAQSLPGAQIVYDCLDHMSGFSNVSPEVSHLEKELIEKSDIVVTTSAYLSDYVGTVRPSTIIRNGCEFEYFSKHPNNLAERSERPVIGYYGAIAEWFDVDLVASIATKQSGWDFVLIGSTAGADVSALAQLPNVRLLGEIPYTELTKHLYGFDVCMIPFKNIELIKATNPVKLYEYLAAGKPVVCTDMPEARLAPSDLVSVTTNEQEFEEAVSAALSEQDDNLFRRRRVWAAENSWDFRAQQYDSVLQSDVPRVSVVVLTYNGLQFNQACLYSLEHFSEYPNLEIICVDNASTDGTREFLQDWGNSRPQHKVILNEKNLGFAAGNNVGIKSCTGEIVILLNNDTYVTRGWIRDLIRPLLQDKTIGLVGPITNMIGGVQKVSLHYRDMNEMAQRTREFTLLRKGDLYETDAIAFFCVAARRKVIDQVGLLDTAYGMGFFEDDDYCQRILKAGFRIVCADGVFVHHHLSASFNELEQGAKGALFKKNRAIFESKWGPWKPHKYRDAIGFGE